MADTILVAKALDDFGDEWHWVVLKDAVLLDGSRFRASRVVTRCGIELDAGPIVVTLHDTGAPDTPTCERCLDVAPGGAMKVLEAISA